MNRFQAICGTMLLLLAGATAAFASPVNYNYASWSSATLSSGSSAGSATGTITIGVNTVNISYSGDVASSTQVGAGGIDYYVPASVYTNSQVANVPTNNNIITLTENPPYTDTLTFSAPLENPILDIVSLGNGGAPTSYNFNATPIILSQGYAYWGGCSTCLSVSGNTLNGVEGSGVIEFVGNYSSISWTTSGGEYWNGFTVGVQGLAPVGTPEPSSLALLGAGLAGSLGVLRRKLAR